MFKNFLKLTQEALTLEVFQAEKNISSSLAFAKNPLPKTALIKDNTPFQVMVIGGTNFVSAIFQNGDYTTREEQKVVKFDSLDNLASLVLKYLKPKIDFLAINFAFPLEPFLRGALLDGKLIRGTKGHVFLGLVDRLVGQELEKYVQNKTGRKVKITLANDTTCLSIAGGKSQEDWQTTITGIVGTGFNFGLFLDSETFVNIESGNFNKFNMSHSGLIIDKNSENPGEQRFEKEVAGAYLPKHFNILNQGSSKKLNTAIEVSQKAEDKNDPESKLAQETLNYSADLVAIEIASLINFQQEKFESIKNQKFTVIIEGSLFWKGYKYYDRVLKTLEQFGFNSQNLSIQEVKDAFIVGASKLVTGLS